LDESKIFGTTQWNQERRKERKERGERERANAFVTEYGNDVG
jgi:hypothetical protein